MNKSTKKNVLLVMVCFFVVNIYAEPLPLLNEKRVIGISIDQGGDFIWRTWLRVVDKHNRESMYMLTPRNDYYASKDAWNYYQAHVADIPILEKSKIKNVDGEDIRQGFIARKKKAIEERNQRLKAKELQQQKEKKAKELKQQKEMALYKKLNTLFGEKIGVVVNPDSLTDVYADDSRPFSAGKFQPEKKFLDFDDYAVFYTVTSHRIYSISAVAPYTKHNEDVAKAALEKKYGETMIPLSGGDYYLKGTNNKGHTRTLTLSRKGNELMLMLHDVQGEALSEKEHAKRQNDVASEATDAL